MCEEAPTWSERQQAAARPHLGRGGEGPRQLPNAVVDDEPHLHHVLAGQLLLRGARQAVVLLDQPRQAVAVRELAPAGAQPRLRATAERRLSSAPGVATI